ncbi:TPA: oligosaccharide flippase family protein [Citrobacter farmeri]
MSVRNNTTKLATFDSHTHHIEFLMIKSAVKILSQSLVRLFCSIVSLKVIAFYAGPAGMLMYGQLQSFMQISSTVVSSVTSTGVVKYTASKEYSEKEILTTAFYMSLLYSLILFFVFWGASYFFVDSLIDKKWIYIFLIIPISSFFYSVTNLILSLFNGRTNYTQYLYYSICNTVLVFIATVALAYIFSLNGVMLSIVLAPVVAFFLCVPFLGLFKIDSFLFLGEGNRNLARLLSQYSLMALTSAILVYGVQIYLRHLISIEVNDSSAGIWFSATKLSEVYMGIISLLFSTLIVPRYSGANGQKQISKEVSLCLKIALPLVTSMILAVYLLAPLVINIIYGESFAEAASILRVYVVGDALKVLTWVYLYVALTKKRTAIYIVYETLSSILYLISCSYFLLAKGMQYMAYGYLIQGVVSLIIISIWFYNGKEKKNHGYI